jgi:hypothetical protein
MTIKEEIKRMEEEYKLTTKQILAMLENFKNKLNEEIRLTENTLENENLIFNLRNHENNMGVAIRAINGEYDDYMTNLIKEIFEQIVIKEKEKEEEGFATEKSFLNPILLQGVYNLIIGELK